jgi:hypothetical protein
VVAWHGLGHAGRLRAPNFVATESFFWIGA